MTGNVVVLGSANVDLVVEVSRRPEAGETIIGSDVHLYPGGKGANQAASSARSGASTRFLCCVGSDPYAALLRERLTEAGVDVQRVQTVERPTGTAMILITPDGENSIVVSPGANYAMDVAAADAVSTVWESADVLVLGLEIPPTTVAHVAMRAAHAGVRILLNAAPALSIPEEILALCDPLIVNENEANTLLGIHDPQPFSEIALELRRRGARSVIITLGSAGSLVCDDQGVDVVPAYRVDVVDTTGAGDAFVGAVACELSRNSSLRDAVRFATAMSALAVQVRGAQSSYKNRSEVETFLARHLITLD